MFLLIFFQFSESATKLTALGCFLGCHQMRMFRCMVYKICFVIFRRARWNHFDQSPIFSGDSPRIYTVNSSGFEGSRFQNMFFTCLWETQPTTAPQLLDFPSDKKKKPAFLLESRGICWFYIMDLLGYSKHINVYLMCLEISSYISVSILRMIWAAL